MLPEHVEQKILRLIEVSEDGCWHWMGWRNSHTGYGYITIENKARLVHRVIYAEYVEPIEADMTIDHLCETRYCVNPDHMEQCTRGENSRRVWDRAKAKGLRYRIRERPTPHLALENACCAHGHEFTEENTYWDPRGHRRCRQCDRDRMVINRRVKVYGWTREEAESHPIMHRGWRRGYATTDGFSPRPVPEVDWIDGRSKRRKQRATPRSGVR